MDAKFIDAKDELGDSVVIEVDGAVYRLRDTAEELKRLPDGRLQHPATMRIYTPTEPGDL